MAQPSPKLVDLALRIVRLEAGGSSDPAASVAAVNIACSRLRDHLIDLLGSGGVSALLKRALHLAKREQPLLHGVAISGEADACLSGLAEALAESADEEAMVVASTIFAHMLDLLVILIGEELGMKPIRKLWPRVTTAGETL